MKRVPAAVRRLVVHQSGAHIKRSCQGGWRALALRG